MPSSETTSVEDFYPRPPRGGRHKVPAGFHHPLKFLSTPSARRATEKFKTIGKLLDEFLSTPSARRATSAEAAKNRAWQISIHALREEGDFAP